MTEKPTSSKVSPALERLLDADASGESRGGHIPLPPDMVRRRKEWAEHFRQAEGGAIPDAPDRERLGEASSGPNVDQRIGPKNPDHPQVNRQPGGRDVP